MAAVQEVFVAVSRNVGRFEPAYERGCFRGWLRRVTRNLLINLLDKRRRQLGAGTGSTDMIRLLQEVPAPEGAVPHHLPGTNPFLGSRRMVWAAGGGDSRRRADYTSGVPQDHGKARRHAARAM